MKIPWLDAVLLPGRAVRGVGAALVVIGLALGPAAVLLDNINASPERLRPEMMLVPNDGPDGGFSIARTEVTQAMYQLVMGTNPSSKQVGDDRPVMDVDSYDAARYCNRLSTLEGFTPVYDESSWERIVGADGYRLPTEQEWQYAAAAGASDTWAGTSDEASAT